MRLAAHHVAHLYCKLQTRTDKNLSIQQAKASTVIPIGFLLISLYIPFAKISIFKLNFTVQNSLTRQPLLSFRGGCRKKPTDLKIYLHIETDY